MLRVHGGGAADLFADLHADGSGGFGAALGGGAIGAIEAKCGAGARVRLHKQGDRRRSGAGGAARFGDGEAGGFAVAIGGVRVFLDDGGECAGHGLHGFAGGIFVLSGGVECDFLGLKIRPVRIPAIPQGGKGGDLRGVEPVAGAVGIYPRVECGDPRVE